MGVASASCCVSNALLKLLSSTLPTTTGSISSASSRHGAKRRGSLCYCISVRRLAVLSTWLSTRIQASERHMYTENTQQIRKWIVVYNFIGSIAVLLRVSVHSVHKLCENRDQFCLTNTNKSRGVMVRERGGSPFRQIFWSRNDAPANIVGHRWNANTEAFRQITSY